MTMVAAPVRERPILFSGPMVRAILDGRKAQTRRVITPQPRNGVLKVWSVELRKDGLWGAYSTELILIGDLFACPFGAVGDRLWVRETWQFADWTEDGEPFVRYAADGEVRFCEGAGEGELLVDTWASLSDAKNYAIDGKAADRRWRPSIFMPRWASRITLEVTAVRVERIQDIIEYDAANEIGWDSAAVAYGNDARGEFRALWDKMNAKRGYGWDVNPWVWVVEFKRLP